MLAISTTSRGLHYRIYGTGDLPVMILLMGLGMSGGQWPDAFVERLVQSGLRVVVPDNRDCGASMRVSANVSEREMLTAVGRTLLRLPVEAPYALEDMALDVELLIDELRERRVHVVGFSMGGMIAQVLATHCPARVASLVSMSSACGNPKTGFGKLSTIVKLLRMPHDRGNALILRQYGQTIFRALEGRSYRADDAEMHAALERFADQGYDAAGTMRQLMAILASGDRSRQCRRIMAPTLVIHGDDDPLLPLAAGQECARLIPDARLEVFPGLGHQLPGELAGRFAELVCEHAFRHPA